MTCLSRAAQTAVALLAAAVVGCASSGTPFDPDSVPKIRPGVTTQAQVQRLFGTPTELRTRASGGTQWVYVHEERRTRSTRTLTRIGWFLSSLLGRRWVVPPVDLTYSTTTRHSLRVFFDDAGVVVDYEYGRSVVPSKSISRAPALRAAA